MNVAELRKKAYELRKITLDVIYDAQAGHLGGDMSIADILTVLFYDVLKHDPKNPTWAQRDRYVQSKGHAVEIYYAVLADSGYFSKDELKTYFRFGSRFIGHPHNIIPGIEICSGALGHGLSVGAGMALGAKMNETDNHIYVLMGDGEQAEGSIWEAAMFSSAYELDNLTAILDRNHLQITGSTEDVLKLEPLIAKWESFGFDVIEIDGHDYVQIKQALLYRVPKKPVLVFANTVKGKGISFTENNVKWHHGTPTEAQYLQAVEELMEGAMQDD